MSPIKTNELYRPSFARLGVIGSFEATFLSIRIMENRLLHFLKKICLTLKSKVTLIPVTIIVLLSSIYFYEARISVYAVHDEGITHVVRGDDLSVDEMLAKMQITLNTSDQIVPLFDENGQPTNEYEIFRAFPVYIHVDGETKKCLTTGGNVSMLLNEAGVTVNVCDELSYPLDTPLESGMEVSISRITSKTEVIPEEIPFQTVETGSIYIDKGSRQVTREGVTGKSVRTYELTLRDGEEVSRRILSDVVESKPVDELVNVGTGGTFTTKSGKVISFRKVIDVKATAYYDWRNSHMTASGMPCRVGVIATDPKVIPMYTKMYVASRKPGGWEYGECIAGDTGSGVDGNWVDLFFNTVEECYSFGLRNARVYILE